MELKVFIFEEAEVRTVTKNNESWFVGKDITEILGYSNTSDALGRHVSSANKAKVNIYDGIQTRAMSVINETGLYLLISQSMNVSARFKENIINWFKSKGFLEMASFSSRKEIEFIDLLEDVLAPLGLSGIAQHKVKSFYVDYYIKSRNIAIEFDEDDHSRYCPKKELERQQLIKDQLGCSFIRVSDKKSNGWNCGYIIKQITTNGKE